MTSLELRSVKDAVDFWWEHRSENVLEYGLPVYIATLLSYVQRMDGCTFDLKDGTWTYPSGVQS